MPFIPHTEQDIKEMLSFLNIAEINALFDEIPSKILYTQFEHIPEGINELELMRLMKQRAKQDEIDLNFMGAGAYEHHIPAAVWDIATRGEFMTAYTPYQAEASQGTLQLLYEYQTMIANLTGMEVSNASLYDGASALAEAVLMAVRLKKSPKPAILVPESIHPYYRQTVESIVKNQQITLIDLPMDKKTGTLVLPDTLETSTEYSALILPQPNYFGLLEDVDSLTDWAHQHKLLVIAVVNPLALGLLKEPGQWGEKGADIVCGELQPLGIPLASGGPYAGFLCTQQSNIRQMPGRIVGATTDKNNQRGFTLTLQAREQHIRRGKAMSNICTNQGLLVTAATIYMSLLGAQGLQQVAARCHENAKYLYDKLMTLKQLKPLFQHQPAFFHEFAVQFDEAIDLKAVLAKLAQQKILAGVELDPNQYPNSLLICVTETKTKNNLDYFVSQLQKHLQEYPL